MMDNLDRLCIHTITTKPWPLETALLRYAKAGVAGITIWRQAYDDMGAKEASRMLSDSDLEVVSLCRGGFFPGKTRGEQQEAIDDNLRIIDEAAQISAPLIVLVCGAVPGMPLDEGRGQIADAITQILPHAEACGVKLAIEPLHPMYADDRSAINTLRQANDIVETINHPNLGVTVDVFHLWWDPELEREIMRAGASIFSFHVCDWRTPTRDLLNDRGLMGEGCIDIPLIRSWVEDAGCAGMIEVEIFSNEYWAMNQDHFLGKIVEAYHKHV
jgi:sugar phosphate isomerase/epimerase